MTPQEEQECLEHAERVAAAENSPWQPRLVAEAFLPQPVRIGGPWSLGPLTMRGWLALDARRSPFLSGDPIPPEEIPGRIAEVLTAFYGIDHDADDVIEHLPPGETAAAIAAIRALVCSAFATALSMASPIQGGEPGKEDGFGSWLPVWTALRKELGMGKEEAAETPVAQALAMLATARHNEGYTVKGENYRIKEIQ